MLAIPSHSLLVLIGLVKKSDFKSSDLFSRNPLNDHLITAVHRSCKTFVCRNRLFYGSVCMCLYYWVLGHAPNQFCLQPYTLCRGFLVWHAYHSQTYSKTDSSANSKWYHLQLWNYLNPIVHLRKSTQNCRYASSVIFKTYRHPTPLRS